MTTELSRLVGVILHGWWEVFVLLMALLVATVLLSWASNRGARPVDRTPLVPALPFLCAFALLMVLKHLHHDRWNAIIIAVGITAAAFVVARSGTRAPVIPLMLLAVLVGFGLHLSALALLVAGLLVLALSRSNAK
jgi:hypothetical protein